MTKSKYFLSASIAAFASQARATSAHPNHTGFYLGINGGYEISKNKMKHNIDGEGHNTTGAGTLADPYVLHSVPFSVSNKSSVNPEGFFGGAFLGYQHQMRCFVAGIEASSSLFKFDKKKILNYNFVNLDAGDGLRIKENIQLRHKYNFGGSIKLGYLVTPTVVAGIKMGYTRDVYNMKISNVLTVIGAPGNPTLEAYNSSKNIKVNSFVPGVYIEKLINNHWLIGGEYNYSISKKKKLCADNFKEGEADDGLSYQGTKSFKPASHAVKIRLGYKF